MSSVVINVGAGIIGKQFRKNRTVTAAGHVVKDPTLAAAFNGSLSTRSSNTAGTLTMADGHGITTGARIDIYWSGGAAYGATVGTVSVDSVPFTGAAGTNLPVQGTVITAIVPTKEAFDAPHATLQALIAGCVVPAYAVFLDSGDAVVAAEYISATQDYLWDVGGLGSNPFGSTDVASVYLSHSDANSSQQVNAIALSN